MGRPMTLNLAKAGFKVRAWNRTPRDFSQLEEAGVEIFADLRPAVKDADVVCVCVLDDDAVRQVLGQIWGELKAGAIVVDHTTIEVATARQMAEQARSHGVQYLDAPISGGAAGAEAATLTIMVGGDREAFDQVQPVLGAMGRLIRHMGPSGSGQATKLVNQLLTAIHQAAAAEALNLARREGLDLEAVQEVLSQSFGASRMVERSVPVVLEGKYESPFTIRILNKDLGLIANWAGQLGVSLPVMNVARDVYRQALEAGKGNRDAAILIEWLDEK